MNESGDVIVNNDNESINECEIDEAEE